MTIFFKDYLDQTFASNLQAIRQSGPDQINLFPLMITIRINAETKQESIFKRKRKKIK